MSKWISPKNTELPSKFTEVEHRFGKASPEICDMKGLMNNDFNRQFLSDNIQKRAYEIVESGIKRYKDPDNKSSKLRAHSVNK
jgi:hypothetical protein